MKPSTSHFLSQFLRWDLRIVLATIVGLGLVISFSLAADGDLLYTFDFGTASSADQAPNAIGVMAGGSVYPKTSGALTYGWDSGLVQAVSRGSAVTDPVLRDYNFASGLNAHFKVGGLAAGNYNFRFYVGDNQSKVATLIRTQGRSATIIKTAQYGSVDVPVVVANSGDIVDIEFGSAASDAGWAINGIRIYESSVVPVAPTFNMTLSPATQTVRASGTAVYSVGITPIEGYGGDISLSISGLVAGITAELLPSQISDLPGVVELRLLTSETTTPLPYEFLLKAIGNDSANVSKTVVVKLVVLSNSEEDTPVTNDPLSQVPGETQSMSEKRAQFELIDEYISAEAERLVNKNNVSEIKGISNDFVAFPVAPDLPPAKGAVEQSLQFLTRTGIIETAVDNAPRGEEDSGPKTLWQRILNGLASPLGG